MNHVATRLCDMVNEYSIRTVSPSLVINHAHIIIRIIYLLQTMNKRAESETLEDGLKRSIKNYCWCDDSSTLIELMTTLLSEHEYKMVILIGESITLELLNVDMVETVYYNLAQSYFLLENYTESYEYYHRVITLPGQFSHYKYKACSQLLMLCSFECIFWPAPALHFVETIYTNFYSRIFSYPSEEKPKAWYSDMNGDFLVTELDLSTLGTSIANMDRSRKSQKTFADNFEAPLFYLKQYLYSHKSYHVVYPIIIFLKLTMLLLTLCSMHLGRSFLLSIYCPEYNSFLFFIMFGLILPSLASLLRSVFIAPGIKYKLLSLCSLLFLLLLLLLSLLLTLFLLGISSLLLLNNYYFYFTNNS